MRFSSVKIDTNLLWNVHVKMKMIEIITSKKKINRQKIELYW